jgi:hypothetical protein
MNEGEADHSNDRPGYRGTRAAVAKAYYLLILALSILGWIIYFYLWRDVISQFGTIELRITLAQIAVLVGVIGGLTAIWIRHNLSRARHGRRGGSSRVVSLNPRCDAFGRRLELPPDEILREARHLVLHADETTKSYDVPDVLREEAAE